MLFILSSSLIWFAHYMEFDVVLHIGCWFVSRTLFKIDAIYEWLPECVSGWSSWQCLGLMYLQIQSFSLSLKVSLSFNILLIQTSRHFVCNISIITGRDNLLTQFNMLSVYKMTEMSKITSFNYIFVKIEKLSYFHNGSSYWCTKMPEKKLLETFQIWTSNMEHIELLLPKVPAISTILSWYIVHHVAL